MPFQRSSGILLHPTCFPSRYGIGDLGKSAYEFIVRTYLDDGDRGGQEG